ncbi:glycosyltransferase [Thermomonospora cellulosilytica]|uniref:Glycosyltransferase involved in cell wall biosynthesis n=1 Tax=Thermomonospora cellulosilytica TaxID=1411118 RepID=A0A7W3MW39_9ACTN|nr:glycosyltransferase [Thermomonospora cellulosilytica]MBA9002966.1 glycosyltransferase involved in cell wall biosynthesis [Thermomonospora cellulosilytica]
MTSAGAGAPMRVAHFSDTFLPHRNGVVTSLRTLIPELHAAGHPGLLVAPGHRSQSPGEVGLALRSIPAGVAEMRLCPPRLRHVARIADWSPALIHVHTPGTVGLLGTLAARRLGLPMVATYHTDLHAYADAYRVPTCALRLMLRAYARRLGVERPRAERREEVIDAANTLLYGAADALVVPTEAILNRNAWLARHPRVVVAPNGVAPVQVPPGADEEFRARWAIPPRAPMVLFVGRVTPEKGVDLLAQAFGDVLKSVPDAWLVLVGALYKRRWLRRVLANAGVAHRTVTTGQQPPSVVGAAYATAQVFGFPSLTDTQALVLHEASLAGVPSVVVDEALHKASPLRDDMILTSPTSADMGAAIAELLLDPDAARARGAAARRRAVDLHPRRQSDLMLSLYRDVRSRAVAGNGEGL